MAIVKVKASAWRLDLGNSSGKHTYTIQVEGVNGKNEDKIANNLMKDWRHTGFIFSNAEKSENVGLLYQRDFDSDQEWRQWAKSFEYPLVELGMRSDTIKVLVKGEKKEKKIKVKRVKRIRKSSGKARICRKCGKPGHNARTCGSAKAVAKTKSLKQCSFCAEFGHNKRTCAEYKKKLV